MVKCNKLVVNGWNDVVEVFKEVGVLGREV